LRDVREDLAVDELAALICSTLEGHGVRVVLSGGSVVSIYSENAYLSYDLDFIQIGLSRRVDPAMEELGFRKEGRHWTHPRSRFLVEFPPRPVQVGEETLTSFAERSTPLGTLRLLPPTECVMDRLAAFYHWNDRQSLEQAVAVARRQSVDLRRIEEWSRGEGASKKFREFSDRLGATRGR
jgi:hypothetical protein